MLVVFLLASLRCFAAPSPREADQRINQTHKHTTRTQQQGRRQFPILPRPASPRLSLTLQTPTSDAASLAPCPRRSHQTLPDLRPAMDSAAGGGGLTAIRLPYRHLRDAEMELVSLNGGTPRGGSPKDPDATHQQGPPAARTTTTRKLVLACMVAAGVQFGWALQLSLLTPYIQVYPLPFALPSASEWRVSAFGNGSGSPIYAWLDAPFSVSADATVSEHQNSRPTYFVL